MHLLLDSLPIGCGFLGVWPPLLDAATQVQEALAHINVSVSVSRTGSSRFDFERRGLSEVVRASVHCYTTEEELQRLLDALRELPGAAAA